MVGSELHPHDLSPGALPMDAFCLRVSQPSAIEVSALQFSDDQSLRHRPLKAWAAGSMLCMPAVRPVVE